MTIQKRATEIPSSVNRRATYDRRTDGLHMTLTEWVGWKRRQFEAAHLEHRKRNGESRIVFDRWLERLK